MDANIRDLRALFHQQVSYRIPQFQRPYAWKKDRQWKPLWADVCNIAERCLNRIEGNIEVLPHFLGAIVLQEQQSNTGEVTKRLVVDGQQRLTTLQLLIKATEQTFRIIGDTVRADRLRELTANKSHHLDEDKIDKTKIRQSNLNDQESFQNAIENGFGDNQSQNRPISQAFSYFQNEVENWLACDSENRDGRADALEEALTKHLQIAAIDLDEDEEPHIIFETLNARGEPLQQSDLVKNTVMYEAGVTDKPEEADKLWGLFNNDWWRNKISKRTHIDRFLNYWLMMRALENVSPDRVASEFRDYIRNKSIENIAEEIRNAGEIYKAIEDVSIQKIKIFLTRIKTLELGAVTPLLLWLYTSDKVTPHQRGRSIKVLESYVVRRMLCGLHTRGLSDLFISLLDRLDKSDPAGADRTVLCYLKSQTSDSRVWPNDRVLTTHIIERSMKGTIARKKMVLEAVEMSFRSDKSEPLGATDKLTLEHIMPQRWAEHWPLPADTDDDETTRKETIENIGNLTLTTDKLNASLSDGPWIEKRQTLKNHSSLFLNKELLEDAPVVWDESAIRKRSECLAEKILQIWPSADKLFEISQTSSW